MALPDLAAAQQHLEAGDAAAAVPLLERVTGALPAYAAAHVLLAQAHEQLGQWDAARRAWQRARFLVPGSPTVAKGIERAVQRGAAPAPKRSGFVEWDPGTGSTRAVVDAGRPPAPVATPPPPVAADTAPGEPVPPAASAPEAAAPEEPAAPVTPPAADTKPPARPRTSGPDLDRLISQLESARIEPNLDPSAVPPADLDDDADDVVSETLARIYAAQEQWESAANVYDQLARQQPERAAELRQKAAAMRAKAQG